MKTKSLLELRSIETFLLVCRLIAFANVPVMKAFDYELKSNFKFYSLLLSLMWIMMDNLKLRWWWWWWWFSYFPFNQLFFFVCVFFDRNCNFFFHVYSDFYCWLLNLIDCCKEIMLFFYSSTRVKFLNYEFDIKNFY